MNIEQKNKEYRIRKLVADWLLLIANWLFLLNSEQNVEECDATGDDSSTAAG